MARQAEHQAKRQLRGGIGIAPRGVEHPDAARLGGLGINIHRIRAGAGDHLQARTGGHYRVRHLIIAGHQHLGVVGQLNQLTGAEFRFAQRPPLHQQLAQLVEGAKVASMLGGKNDFHGCTS